MRFFNMKIEFLLVFLGIVSSETVYVTLSTTLWLPSPSSSGVPQITQTTQIPEIYTAPFDVSGKDSEAPPQIVESKEKNTSVEYSEELQTAVSESTGSAYIQPFPPVTAKHIGIIWDFEKSGISKNEVESVKKNDDTIVDVSSDTNAEKTEEDQNQPESHHLEPESQSEREPEPQSGKEPESETEESNENTALNLNINLLGGPENHEHETSLGVSEYLSDDSADTSLTPTLTPTPTEPWGSESEKNSGSPTELYDLSRITSDLEPPAPTSASTLVSTSTLIPPSALVSTLRFPPRASPYLATGNGSRQVFQYSYPHNFLQRNHTQVSSASHVTNNLILNVREILALLMGAVY